MDTLEINIEYEKQDDIDITKLNKMFFIYNALENGWGVKKKNNLYVFSKNHEGKKEVLLDDYLKNFIKKNFKKTN